MATATFEGSYADKFGIVKRVPNKLAPWLGLNNGKKCYPLGPRPEDFTVPMIAHALSNLCRYNGQTSHFWSVAAHSLEVAAEVYAITKDKKVSLDALMHDAGECVLCDIPKPLKPLIPNYKLWEDAVDLALAERFDLSYPMDPIISVTDSNMVLVEVWNFFPPFSEIWKRYDIKVGDNYSILKPLHPRDAEQMFIDAFCYYNGGME
jgi:hypothetical protein